MEKPKWSLRQYVTKTPARCGAVWASTEWLRRFPRTSSAPGMVAARRGHVFVIKQGLGGGKVLAYDANSGGRRTRLHVRSLAGFAVVNPHG